MKQGSSGNSVHIAKSLKYKIIQSTLILLFIIICLITGLTIFVLQMENTNIFGLIARPYGYHLDITNGSMVIKNNNIELHAASVIAKPNKQEHKHPDISMKNVHLQINLFKSILYLKPKLRQLELDSVEITEGTSSGNINYYDINHEKIFHTIRKITELDKFYINSFSLNNKQAKLIVSKLRVDNDDFLADISWLDHGMLAQGSMVINKQFKNIMEANKHYKINMSLRIQHPEANFSKYMRKINLELVSADDIMLEANGVWSKNSWYNLEFRQRASKVKLANKLNNKTYQLSEINANARGVYDNKKNLKLSIGSIKYVYDDKLFINNDLVLTKQQKDGFVQIDSVLAKLDLALISAFQPFYPSSLQRFYTGNKFSVESGSAENVKISTQVYLDNRPVGFLLSAKLTDFNAHGSLFKVFADSLDFSMHSKNNEHNYSLSVNNLNLTAPKHYMHERKLKNKLISINYKMNSDADDYIKFKIAEKHMQAVKSFVADIYINKTQEHQIKKIYGEVTHADIKEFIDFIPTLLLTEKAREWLLNSNMSGELNNLRFYKSFLDENRKNLLWKFSADIANAELVFDTHWPILSKANLHIMHDVEGFKIQLIDGIIANTLINDAFVLFDYQNKHVLTYQLSGPILLNNLQDLIVHSPLTEKFNRYLKHVSLHGDAQFKVKGMLPLKKSKNAEFSGSLVLQDAEASVIGIPINWKNIKGKILFDQHKSTTSLSANWEKNPQTIVGKSNTDNASLEFLINGSLPLGSMFETPIRDSLQGSTPYVVSLTNPGEEKTMLSFKSDFTGIRSNLPAPLAKDSKQAIPSELTLGIDKLHNLSGKLSLGKRAYFDIQIKNQQNVENRACWIGLHAHSKFIDLDKFASLYKQLGKSKHNSACNDLALVGEVEADSIMLMHNYAKNRRFKLDVHPSFGKVFLDGEGFAGVLDYVDNPHEFVRNISIDKIAIDDYIQHAAESVTPEVKQVAEKKQVATHIKIGEVTYKTKLIGKLDMSYRENSSSNIDAGDMKLDHEKWHMHALVKPHLNDKNQQEMGVDGDVTIKDLGDLSGEYLNDKHMVGGEGKIHISVANIERKPNKPLQALFDVDIHEGVITNLGKNVEQKLELGKVINAFSIETFFKLFTKHKLKVKGFKFESIKGGLALDDKNIKLTNLQVEGNEATIMVNGVLDINKRMQDLNIDITPKLTNSLPALSMLLGLGNPIIPAVTWILNKTVISKVTSKLVTSHYKVGGQWESPQVEKYKITHHNLNTAEKAKHIVG